MVQNGNFTTIKPSKVDLKSMISRKISESDLNDRNFLIIPEIFTP